MTRKKTVWLSIAGGLVVVIAVLAIGGPIFYRDVIVGPPAAVPTVAVTPGGSSLAGTELAGTWKVASGSTAGYRVKEVLNGTDVTVVGSTKNVTGEFTFATNTLTAGSVEVDVASIATDSSSRDEYFRTSALETDIHPTATFTLSSPVAVANLAAGKLDRFTVAGRLTLHGVTRAVTVPMEAALSGRGAKVSGSIPVTFADYGVQAPSLGFVTVQKKGSVEFLLDAAPAS